MDARRQLAHRVLEEGWCVAEAARRMGVSRTTAHLWVARAREQGIAQLAERSRRPGSSPRATPPELIEELLALKARHPAYGGRMLAALMQGRVSWRTASRILQRAGLTRPSSPQEPMRRFEREHPNELWQMDFKGMRQRRPLYEPLSILDDASRFCVALPALENQRLASVWQALWEAFGEYGLPEAILTDNGPAFRNNGTWRPSTLDLRLSLLGVRSLHGRPYHPQTQGKVERFHGTMARELGPALWQGSLEEGAAVLEAFRLRYNWERPHQALGMRPPGAVYAPSGRARPDHLPEPEYEEGALLRKVSDPGVLTYQGRSYRVGRALIGSYVKLDERDDGLWVVYHHTDLGQLDEFLEDV